MIAAKPPPPDTRPYRQQHEPGDELTITAADRTLTWRQIGWHGQTGALYSLDENPGLHEPGSFSPLWLLIDNEPVVTDEPDQETT